MNVVGMGLRAVVARSEVLVFSLSKQEGSSQQRPRV